MHLKYVYGLFICLCLTLATNSAVRANTIIQNIQQANPNERILFFFRYLDSCLDVHQNDAFVNSFFNEVKELAVKISDERLGDYATFYSKAEPFITQKDTTGRVADLNNLLVEEETTGRKPIFIATCRYFIGQNLFDQGNYTHGFENMLMAQEMFSQIGYQNIPEIGKYLHYLSLDYYSFAYYDKAIELLQSSSKYPPYDNNLDMQIYNTIGMCYRRQGMWDSATRYFNITIAKAKKYSNAIWVGIASGNLARIYMENDRYQEAIPLLIDDYESSKITVPVDAFESSLDLATAYIGIGDVGKAQEYIMKSKLFMQDKDWYSTYISTIKRVSAKYYASLSKFYKSTGNIQLAYTYLDSSAILNRSLAQEFNTDQLKLVEKKLEIQKYQLSAELDEKESRITTVKNWLMNIGLLLVAVLFGSAYWILKAKKSRQLEIEVEKNRVATLEKQALLQEERSLQQKLLQSQSELLAYVQRLNDKNELLDKVATELAGIQQGVPEAEKRPDIAETIQHLTDATLLTNEGWEEFKEKFNSVYPDFFNNIIAKYPDVTASELRLIALSKLDVGTKQMGLMLGISTESIRKSKYRIRKKLNLKGDADLGLI